MNKEQLIDFLVQYEIPLWMELISPDWAQTLCGKYVAHKIKRELNIYEERQERKKQLQL